VWHEFRENYREMAFLEVPGEERETGE